MNRTQETVKLSVHLYSRLTACPLAAILCPLSPSLAAVRGGSRKNQEMPNKARQYRSVRSQKAIILWWALSGELKGSRGSLAPSSNPNHDHRPTFGRVKRCSLTPFKRVHTMPQSNSAQHSGQDTPTSPELAASNAFMNQCAFPLDGVLHDLFTCAKPNLTEAQLKRLASFDEIASIQSHGLAAALSLMAGQGADKLRGNELSDLLNGMSCQAAHIADLIRLSGAARGTLDGLR